jgi:ubiquitin-associated SH3 domain-containing protein
MEDLMILDRTLEDHLERLELIVYACPLGELAQAIDRYFAMSLAQWGANAAHRYMPHCSLTGFFQEWAVPESPDTMQTLSIYHDVLTDLFGDASVRSTPTIAVKALHFRSDWYGLELESPGIKAKIQTFIQTLQIQHRHQHELAPIRPKEWLHLSLAYEFSSIAAMPLKQLAQDLINPELSIGWEVRFYQRMAGNQWHCHGHWEL